VKNFIKFLLRSHLVFRLNKRTRFIDYYSIYKTENSYIRKWFIKKLTFFKVNSSKKKEILLIQIVEDYSFILKMAAASKIYAKENKLKVHFYDSSWIKWIGWLGPLEEKYSKFFKSSLYKMYESFGGKVIYKAEDKYFDQTIIKKELKLISSGIKTPEDILKIKIENIVLGDLIYDTYLRVYQQPTIQDIYDKRLETIIEVSLNMFYNFKNLVKEYQIHTLFTSYTSYIGHGVVSRICLDKNINVITFGSPFSILEKSTKEEPYHATKHWEFSPTKSITSDKLEEAKNKLTSRFRGEIDSAVSYMRATSFSVTNLSEELKKKFTLKNRNVVIYTHDFYDSPHINRSLLFNDLYQFLKNTLENIGINTNTNYWIKIHPNGIGDCKERTIELVNSFNFEHFHILEETVSNLHIVELKPDLIVTARGTVAMEMAYFEIPVVALSDNPYVNFDFAYSCNDLETYYAIIRGENNAIVDFDKTKIYSYYYQAYLEKLEGIDLTPFHLLQNFKGEKYSDEFLEHIKINEDKIVNESFVESYKIKFSI
jgi:hypothetical protein